MEKYSDWVLIFFFYYQHVNKGFGGCSGNHHFGVQTNMYNWGLAWNTSTLKHSLDPVKLKEHDDTVALERAKKVWRPHISWPAHEL